MRCLSTLAILGFLFAGCSPAKKVMPSPVHTDSIPPKSEENLLKRLLQEQPGGFDSILNSPQQWGLQILFTQIDRDDTNNSRFTTHSLNLDPNQYFYPASTVKMPVALLSLQKIRQLNQPGLNRQTAMITGHERPDQSSVYNDPQSADGAPSIANYIKKIFLVSDNDAYNRLYEFCGQQYINEQLLAKGYSSSVIRHRLESAVSEEGNRHTNPIRFTDSSGNTIYQQPGMRSSFSFPEQTIRMGKGYYSGGKLVQQPFDFSKKNRLALADLHRMLQVVLFPKSFNEKERFDLDESDYQFIYQYMSMWPRESSFPQYRQEDGYVKFLMMGGGGMNQRPSLRIFNKVGDAYGFLIDAAYIVDFETGVEFLLSATIHCNSDGIYNDDKYEYDTVGFPFLKHLGEVLYQHELKRKKERLPDLSRFKMTYRP